MRQAVAWVCFGLGSAGFVLGVLLTQAPGRNHTPDLSFLLCAAALLVVACWLLRRVNSGMLRNAAITVALFEVLIAAYGVASIVTYRR